ncbi:NADP or NADPH binding protein [Arthrobacter sp. Hiyo6]|nr:NADP or NADPH binding protein [Arthrobacter sp. Hiyo6]
MYLAQANNIPGIHVVAIADINVKRAEGAFALVDWPAEQIAPDIAAALKNRTTAIVANADELFDVDIDVIVEATGNPIVGIKHALRAIETKKHIIMVTVEADALAGPALAKRAEAAGVVYSMAYGDQPALIMELVDWARTSGFDVVCAGKGAKYLEHYHEMNPDNVWENWEFSKELTDSGQLNPYMHTSFRDGTKAAIEMAAVANGAGLEPSDSGLSFTPGNVEEIATICRPSDVGGALAHEGSVDVMSSVTREGSWISHNTQEGVFVVVKARTTTFRAASTSTPGTRTPPASTRRCTAPTTMSGLSSTSPSPTPNSGGLPLVRPPGSSATWSRRRRRTLRPVNSSTAKAASRSGASWCRPNTPSPPVPSRLRWPTTSNCVTTSPRVRLSAGTTSSSTTPCPRPLSSAAKPRRSSPTAAVGA